MFNWDWKKKGERFHNFSYKKNVKGINALYNYHARKIITLDNTLDLFIILLLALFTWLHKNGLTNLEESLEPPHLENALSDQHSQLEDTPPLHTGVGALGRVPVNPLSHDNVRLLILNLC